MYDLPAMGLYVDHGLYSWQHNPELLLELRLTSLVSKSTSQHSQHSECTRIELHTYFAQSSQLSALVIWTMVCPILFFNVF